ELEALVISVGTGGTISGVGRYFKEHSPHVKIVGVDPEGSVYTAKSDADLHPYLVEGIGKDTWPETMDPKVVDEWVRVSDRESFRWARRLAREAARPGQARADDDPRLRAQLPVEVLRRQLDARARLPRAPGAAADGRRGA